MNIMEYLLLNMWQVWTVIAVVCLILELTAGDFFIICFSIGAVFAALTAAVGLNVYWQLALFAVFTLICLFWVRPFAKRYLHRHDANRASNADALMGRQGRVVEAIEAGGYGRVQIDGDVWKAVSHDGQPVGEGATVCVVGRESTIISVKIV